MADPRSLYFIIDQRERRPWMDADEKPLYRTVDAEPLPTEPQREHSSYPRRLASRLQMIIRPGTRAQGALR